MHPILLRKLKRIAASYWFQQFAPIILLIAVPTIILFVGTRLLRLINMLFDAIGSLLGWNSNRETDSQTLNGGKRRGKSRKAIRTVAERNEQLQEEDVDSENTSDVEPDGYFPGLVNISGTYCFMNSVLQAMASLSYLPPYIDAVRSKAEELDVPTPVVDSLQEILISLNTPKTFSTSLRPIAIINSLSNPSNGKQSSLFSSREHQDAQELFQLLSESIKRESTAVEKEGFRDRGLGGLVLNNGRGQGEPPLYQGVFDGLTANRRSCVECGYTEAVMHFAFDNWQLALPRLMNTCTIYDCLSDYIRLELLTDCICRKCSMEATHARLSEEFQKVSGYLAPDSTASQTKKKRAREIKRQEARVRVALEAGRVEEDPKGVKMEKVISKASTKQVMIARPPRVLVLHLNRSIHYGGYAGKNSCRVTFPEILDLTPYTTSGQLSTVPSVPLSSPPPAIPRCTTPTQNSYSTPRVLYRLAAVVCHYGQHSFGHYVCFRRKPRTRVPESEQYHITLPTLSCPVGCECTNCLLSGPVRDNPAARPGTGWFRISDTTVDECGLERVLAEGVGAFMLFYERVVQKHQPIYPLRSSPRSSEETLRPELVNESSHSMSVSMSMSGSGLGDSGLWSLEKSIGPRVVRNVTAGRSRGGTPEQSMIKPAEPSEAPEPKKLPNGVGAPMPMPNGVIEQIGRLKSQPNPTTRLPIIPADADTTETELEPEPETEIPRDLVTPLPPKKPAGSPLPHARPHPNGNGHAPNGNGNAHPPNAGSHPISIPIPIPNSSPIQYPDPDSSPPDPEPERTSTGTKQNGTRPSRQTRSATRARKAQQQIKSPQPIRPFISSSTPPLGVFT